MASMDLQATGRWASPSEAGLNTRVYYLRVKPDEKADATNQSNEAPLPSSDISGSQTTTVAQVVPEVDPVPIASERPRRQKRRSLKLMIPSLRPGRRRSLSLPPIIASVVALQPKRTTTSPSPQHLGKVSSSPTSPKRFWHALRSSLKDSGLNDDIQVPVPDEIPEDARPILDDGNDEGMDGTYCDSPLSDYHSMFSDPGEELDPKHAFDVPEELSSKDSTPVTSLELVTTGPSTGAHFQVFDSSSETKQMDGPSPIDPAYRALLPIVYGLEAITLNPRRRSVGEEHDDEDYAKFWETFGQLSAKEVLCAVYAIRAGAFDVPIEPFNEHPDLPLLTTFCAIWAALATILAVYFYFCSK